MKPDPFKEMSTVTLRMAADYAETLYSSHKPEGYNEATMEIAAFLRTWARELESKGTFTLEQENQILKDEIAEAKATLLKTLK
jgi:hypothetical protein